MRSFLYNILYGILGISSLLLTFNVYGAGILSNPEQMKELADVAKKAAEVAEDLKRSSQRMRSIRENAPAEGTVFKIDQQAILAKLEPYYREQISSKDKKILGATAELYVSTGYNYESRRDERLLGLRVQVKIEKSDEYGFRGPPVWNLSLHYFFPLEARRRDSIREKMWDFMLDDYEKKRYYDQDEESFRSHFKQIEISDPEVQAVKALLPYVDYLPAPLQIDSEKVYIFMPLEKDIGSEEILNIPEVKDRFPQVSNPFKLKFGLRRPKRDAELDEYEFSYADSNGSTSGIIPVSRESLELYIPAARFLPRGYGVSFPTQSIGERVKQRDEIQAEAGLKNAVNVALLNQLHTRVTELSMTRKKQAALKKRDLENSNLFQNFGQTLEKVKAFTQTCLKRMGKPGKR